jgi:hypothetical protein
MVVMSMRRHAQTQHGDSRDDLDIPPLIPAAGGPATDHGGDASESSELEPVAGPIFTPRLRRRASRSSN